MTQQFKAGQRVHVEYEGVVTESASPYVVEVRTENDAYHVANVRYVTPLDPANWPPQVGDIWELDGEEYAIRASTMRPGRLYITPLDGRIGFYVTGIGGDGDQFKNSNPTLIRRRGDALLFRQDGK